MPRYFPDPRDTQPGTEQSAELMRNTISQSMKQINPSSSVGVKRFGDNLILQGGGGGGKSLTVVRLALFGSINPDGNTIEVFFVTGSGVSPISTTIYKPLTIQAQHWYKLTLSYADGRDVYYDLTGGLDITYQRCATWIEGDDVYTAIEEITPLYYTNEPLYVMADIHGNLIDFNNNSKGWARAVGQE